MKGRRKERTGRGKKINKRASEGEKERENKAKGRKEIQRRLVK